MNNPTTQELPQLNWDDFANFNGTIEQKLPNAEFVVRLTQFPDGTKISPESNVTLTCKLTGKIRDRKIRIAISDNVVVSISMESATQGKGQIIYRDRIAGQQSGPVKRGRG